jgi:two-component sensor histidine kinase
LTLPKFYVRHGIVSTIDVIIKGLDGPAYGVLEIDSPIEHSYDENDIIFLTGFANVLAEAVATQTRVEALITLVAEKNLLARELNHRVRNNLQLIQALLDAYGATLPEGPGKQGIETIALRLMTMAHMYDHLLGSGMSEKIDFGIYVNTLCENIATIQHLDHSNVNLICTIEPLFLALDTITGLGLVALN